MWDFVDGQFVVTPGRPGSRHSAIFRADMLVGEGQEIFAERMQALGRGLCEKTYIFQVRNDDGRGHFRTISRRYLSLQFVLAYHDPNMGEYGSYLIGHGRSRPYLESQEFIEFVMAKHEYDYDSDDDDNESRYWEASWELADHADARWLNLVYKRLGIHSSGQ